MDDDQIEDGRHIARLLAAEIEGHENPPLDRLSVDAVGPDAEMTVTGD